MIITFLTFSRLSSKFIESGWPLYLKIKFSEWYQLTISRAENNFLQFWDPAICKCFSSAYYILGKPYFEHRKQKLFQKNGFLVLWFRDLFPDWLAYLFQDYYYFNISIKVELWMKARLS